MVPHSTFIFSLNIYIYIYIYIYIFNIYIYVYIYNDLGYTIKSNVVKFSDETQVFRRVNNDGDKQHLQNDLDKLVEWSEKWQMLLNFGQCKCLHTGHGNLIKWDILFQVLVQKKLQYALI